MCVPLPQLGLNSLVKPRLRLLVIQDPENKDMKFDDRENV